MLSLFLNVMIDMGKSNALTSVITSSLVSLLLLVLSFIFPFMSVPLIMFMPCPFLLVSYTYKTGHVAAALALTLVGAYAVAGPDIALGYCLAFGAVGAALGKIIKRTRSFGDILIIGITLSLIGKLLAIGLIYLDSGVNILAPDKAQLIDIMLDLVKNDEGGAAVGAGSMILKDAITAAVDDIVLLLPFSLIAMSAMEIYTSLSLSYFRVKKLTGEQLFDKISLSKWRLPKNTLIVIAASFMMSLVSGQADDMYIVRQIAANLGMLGRMLMMIEGAALCAFYLERIGAHRIVINIAVLAPFLFSFAGDVFFFAGMIDILFDLRARVIDK